MATILVIEDERHLRETLHDMLFLEGYSVELASDGKEGIAKVLQIHPDLIICDVMMPEMNGYEVLKILRSAHTTIANVPFIFLTAKAERQDQRLGMELGADDYLHKPFEKNEVFRAIRTQLQRRQKLHEEITTQLNKLQGSATIALNHEYLTPMTSIKSGLELLSMYGEQIPAEQQKEIIATSLQGAFRLEKLMHHILLFQKIFAGLSLAQEHLRPLDITVLLRKIVPILAEKHHRTHIIVNCSQRKILADSEYLLLILTEILDNALKFSPPETAISISGIAHDERYVLRITDHGRGMLPEHIKQIGAFMQFEREIYEQQGVGLGLFLARELTRICYGTMTIESVSGTGTTVELSFLPA